MGTHPIFESDFDCLTGMENMDPSSIYEIDDFKNKIHLLLSERNTKNKLKAHLRSEILNCSVYNGYSVKVESKPDLDERIIIRIVSINFRHMYKNSLVVL